jgi:Protein of unknown function DUF262/HNH endonuclease
MEAKMAEIASEVELDNSGPEPVELELESENDENESLDLPANSFTPVNFSSGTRRIVDLYRAYSIDKDLDPRPSFQRGYVWDRNRASKLVESILLHVPIPLIYTAEEDDGKEVVIDGQQRLTTCFSFIEGFFPASRNDSERAEKGHAVKRKPFRLGKMKILKDLEGKSYKDLSEDYRKSFDKYNLQIIKISKDSHPDVKFEIFERLNTGSVSLSDQEIRNCIYRGAYNNLLCELASHDTFRKLLGLTGEATRMQDVELVLRFMAFNESTHINYNTKMRAFLNGHMRDRRDISTEIADKFKRDFVNACEVAYTVFGDKAFRRFSAGSSRNPNGGWERSLNKAVFDCMMFWFARTEKRQVIGTKDAVCESFIDLCLNDQEFVDSITLGTADPTRVKTRFTTWKSTIDKIISVPFGEKRLFSYQQKQELFEEDQTCGICKQRIENVDDAAVDHHMPFSTGGPTELSNAVLAHRYCNRQKGVAVPIEG